MVGLHSTQDLDCLAWSSWSREAREWCAAGPRPPQGSLQALPHPYSRGTYVWVPVRASYKLLIILDMQSIIIRIIIDCISRIIIINW